MGIKMKEFELKSQAYSIGFESYFIFFL